MIPPREQSARCEDIFDHHDQGDAANIWWAEGPGMQLNTLPGTGQPQNYPSQNSDSSEVENAGFNKV